MTKSTLTLKQQNQLPQFKQNFFEKQIFSILKEMKKGQLTIELPDGPQFKFGENPDEFKATIFVKDRSFFRRALLFADIGLAESYLDGQWETDDIRAVISWFLLNFNDSPVLNESGKKRKYVNLLTGINQLVHKTRINTEKMSRKNISEHYDLGNNFFSLFLDESMTYSSALFENEGATLAQAQIAKYARLAKMLRLKADDRVLEIGCGWGGFSLYAAKNIGCHITAVTISEEQFARVKKLVNENNLSDRIDVQLIDYRKITGSFDKIISIEMLEAVGEEFVDGYFAKCDELLKPDGLLALQFISSPDSRYDTLRRNVDFIQKYIFPGSLLQSIGRVNQALNKSGDLHLYNLHDMGNSYVKTLALWQARFQERLDDVRQLGFDERFIRKWNYYFSYCQAAFDMRNISVVQAVYTRPNNASLRDLL